MLGDEHIFYNKLPSAKRGVLEPKEVMGELRKRSQEGEKKFSKVCKAVRQTEQS